MIPDFEAGSSMIGRENWRMRRSKSPIRKRRRLPSVVDGDPAASLRAEESTEEAAASVVDEVSSSSSCFLSEITSESGTFYARSKRPRKTDQTIEDHAEQEFRRITRSYAKRREKLKVLEENRGSSGWINVFPGSCETIANVDQRDEHNFFKASSSFTTSGTSNVSAEFRDENGKEMSRSRARGREALEMSDSHYPDSTSLVSSREFDISSYSSRRQNQRDLENLTDLSCSEHFSDSDESPGNSSSAPTLSEYGSDENCNGLFSGYSSSLVPDGSDDCSETRRKKSAPSFLSFLLTLGSEFCPSPKESPHHEHEYSHEFTLLKFESHDDEVSYEMFRRRERNQAMLHDYTEAYGSRTDFGELLVHQRLVMINWMVEHANTEELQCETLFLGVSLMDRVLCKGFFKAKRNLQLLGIACLILAIRLEENQPYNCVRRKSFYVESNTYSRRDVVAMEWFIQELLKFQCLPLTTFNFLWFYLKAARADAAMENLAKYLAVVSLLDHERLAFWPSTVAAGIVILAALATGHDDSCNRVMETHVRTKNDDLSECIQSLQWLVKYAD